VIRSLATTATSSRGGSKNGNRIEGYLVGKCGSQELDAASSRLATGTLAGSMRQRREQNSALNFKNEAQSPSSVNSPCLRFRSRPSGRPHRFPLRQSLTFQYGLYKGWFVQSRSVRMRRAHRLLEFWHSLLVSASRGYIPPRKNRRKARSSARRQCRPSLTRRRWRRRK
jgi:hypothetical protein